MIVTNNNLKNLVLQAVATKRKAFDDSRENPLPDTFDSLKDYDEWRKNMYDMITSEYSAGRQAGPSQVKPRMIAVYAEIEQVKDQLNGSYAEFRQGLMDHATRAIGLAQAGDLMDTLRHLEHGGFEGEGVAEDARQDATSDYQAPGFAVGQTGTSLVDTRTGKTVSEDEAHLASDFEAEGLNVVDTLFGGD